MPAHKGIRANAKEIERLIVEKNVPLKGLVESYRRKTLDRARKGLSISEESMQYLATVFEVDASVISIEEDQPLVYQRFMSLKLIRAESLKGFPKSYFEIGDFDDYDLLKPFEVEARFEVDDPSEEQAEIAAQLVDSVEAMIEPQKPSAMIRAKGKLNNTIRKLTKLGIYLYVGSYRRRCFALPFTDMSQDETALGVIRNHLLLVFNESRKSRALQRKVDQGMNVDELKETEDWVNEQLEKETKDQLDERELRHLNKMRQEAKQVFVNY